MSEKPIGKLLALTSRLFYVDALRRPLLRMTAVMLESNLIKDERASPAWQTTVEGAEKRTKGGFDCKDWFFCKKKLTQQSETRSTDGIGRIIR